MTRFAPATRWLALTDEERDALARTPRTRTAIAAEYGGMDPAYITRWRAKRKIPAPDLPRTASTPKTYRRVGPGGALQVTAWSRMYYEDRVQFINAAHARGETRAQMIAALGCGLSTLTAFIREHGLTRAEPVLSQRGRGAWHRYPPEEKLRTFLEAKDKATSINRICILLDLNKDTVKAFAKKNTITLDFPVPVRQRTIIIKDPMRGNVPGLAPRPNPVQPPPSKDRMPQDTPTRVHLFDSRVGQCRFPLWADSGNVPVTQMFFCGAPVENPTTSYCAHCRAIVYRPLDARPRKPTGASWKASIRRA